MSSERKNTFGQNSVVIGILNQNLMDIGKDYLTNYDMFSETNHKLNVALLLHQKLREKIFSRFGRADIFSWQ